MTFKFARLGILFLLLLSPGLPGARAAAKEEVAVIQTEMGEIAFRFLGSAAPQHAAYVKELIAEGFYDGATFHRVIPHFVIQGGDPNSKDSDRSNDGNGEAARRLKAEFSESLHYRPGTVGMARDVDPDSGSCQFFIALEAIPRLDGRYTIFGEVISGLEEARRIAQVPRDLLDNPLERIEMKVILEPRKIPSKVLSSEPDESGEVVTGPDKPKPWDPGNVHWSPPRLTPGSRKIPKGVPPTALDISIDREGAVLDVRFRELEVEKPEQILSAARGWRFKPVLFQDQPAKTRFAMDSRGGEATPSRAPGTPVELEDGIVPPSPAIPVLLAAGARRPDVVPVLRLTVGADGRVGEVSLQVSCGDPALDQQAVENAGKLVFQPAESQGEATSVYLTLRGQFLEDGRD